MAVMRIGQVTAVTLHVLVTVATCFLLVTIVSREVVVKADTQYDAENEGSPNGKSITHKQSA